MSCESLEKLQLGDALNMATISSHILNSVTGDHAGGIVVELFRLHDNRDKEKIFSVTASSTGRIAETVGLSLMRRNIL